VTNTCAQVHATEESQLFHESLGQVAHLLPDVVKELGDRVGVHKAFRLAKIMGGTSTYIPKNENCEAAKLLANKIGDICLLKELIKIYEGEFLYIPSCAVADRELRNIDIHLAAATGIAVGRSMNQIVNDLALTHLISDRHVWRILKKLPAPLKNLPSNNLAIFYAQHNPSTEIH
jgi:Mor family transcriptional regulator